MENQAEIVATIVKIIRDGSETGQLVRSDDILAELIRQGLLESENAEQKAQLETTLKRALRENLDLKEVSGRSGIAHYHSVQTLSSTYAGILVRKSDSPLWLMAEAVRENSRLYPRPVPVDSFREQPFGLTPDEIVECLTTMGELREYQDIAQTITSIGTPFLYSTQHLDPDHASTLAEWLDVGLVNNP